jgi:hypothetical protein
VVAWEPDDADNNSDILDVKAQNKKLSSIILRTGGVTFLAFACLGFFSFLGAMLLPSSSVYFGLKLACLITNVAWYWISANEEMRDETDKIFQSAWKFLSYVIQR